MYDVRKMPCSASRCCVQPERNVIMNIVCELLVLEIFMRSLYPEMSGDHCVDLYLSNLKQKLISNTDLSDVNT